MKSLEANNYILVKDEFEDGLKRQQVYLEFHGKQDFETVLKLLTEFVKRTSTLDELGDTLYPEY